MAKNVVGVVVVNWNDVDRSVRCLDSVAATAPDSILLLVDNGSSTPPPEYLYDRFDHLRLVTLGKNAGYAAGCNAGARAAFVAGATHVLFLNNDTQVEAGAVDALLAADLDQPGRILGPKIVYQHDPGRVWSAGGLVVRRSMENHHVGKDDPAVDHVQPARVDWTTGCAFFVSAETYRRIGPLDESYFMYLEDTDWCLRAARLGVSTWLVPEAVVRHEVSATVDALPSWHVRYYAYRNHYRLALRHAPPAARPLVLADACWTLARALLRSGLSAGHRRDTYYHARTRGVADFLLGRQGPAPQ